MAQKPCQRIYHAEPSIPLASQYQNLLLDERCKTDVSYIQPILIKGTEKKTKSSDSLVMRRVRRRRTVFTNEQFSELKSYFRQCKYINSKQAEKLAAKLNLEADPVKFWFKNQRRRDKMKESRKQADILSYKDEQRICLTAASKFAHKGLQITLPTPPPKPPPFVTDVAFLNSFDRSCYNPVTCGNEQVASYPSLREVTTSTPTRFVDLQVSQQPNSQYHQLHYSHYIPTPVIDQQRASNLTSMLSPKATEDVQMLTSISNNSDTSDYFSHMSSNSEIYEPLTPKSVCDEADSVFDVILDSLKTPKAKPTIESIYEKLISAREPNFNCALESYNSRTNSHYLELV